MAKLLEAEPLTDENACRNCNATGLVRATRLAYEAGVLMEVETKYRATCPECHGSRRLTHDQGLCTMCRGRQPLEEAA